MARVKKQTDYRTQRLVEINQQIDEIEKELPSSVRDFIRAVSTTTTPLTRLAYVYDLRTFFFFLKAECPEFADVKPNQMTTEHFNLLTQRQLEIYQDYLRQYVRPDYDGDTDGAAAQDEQVMIQNHEIGIARKLSSLRAFFKYLYTHDMIRENVTEKVVMPKIRKKPIIFLERDEINRMFDALEDGEGLTKHQKAYLENTRIRDRAIITLLLGTGIRSSELVGLNKDDLDLDNNAFVVTRKGGNQAILYYNDQVKEALADYLAVRDEVTPVEGHEDALFLSTQRKRISPRALQDLVKKYAKVGAPLKKVSVHKMRSTFGTSLYRETGDIYLVASALGHADVNTTKAHYAAENEEKRRQASRNVTWLPQ